MTPLLQKPGMQIAVPRWSPDGKTIAFIGGLMSDEGSVGGDVYAIPAAGGDPRDLTPGMNASASRSLGLPIPQKFSAPKIRTASRPSEKLTQCRRRKNRAHLRRPRLLRRIRNRRFHLR